MKPIVQSLVTMLVASSPSIASAQNIIVNGSFETGSFAGWTQTGDLSVTGVTNSPLYQYHPTEGNYQALFGPWVSYGGIVQYVGEIGKEYTVAFDIANRSGPAMYVVFGGHQLLVNSPQGPYVHYSFNVSYDAPTGLLFQFYNPVDYYYLDNVSVTPFAVAPSAVPEPASWAMVMMGFGAMGFALRRKKVLTRVRFA